MEKSLTFVLNPLPSMEIESYLNLVEVENEENSLTEEIKKEVKLSLSIC